MPPPPPPLVLRGDVFPIHICTYSRREKIFFSIRHELYSILYIVTYRYLVYGYDAKRVVVLPDVYGLPGPGGGPRLVYFLTFSAVVIVAVLYVILLLFDADTLYSACEINRRQSRSAAVARECCETRHAYLSNVGINSDRIRWKRALVHSPEHVKKHDAVLKHKAKSCKNRPCTSRGRARRLFFFRREDSSAKFVYPQFSIRIAVIYVKLSFRRNVHLRRRGQDVQLNFSLLKQSQSACRNNFNGV